MYVVTSLAGVLLLFQGDAMRVGPWILTDAGHLPGDFHGGFVSLYAELMIGDLASHYGLSKLPEDREPPSAATSTLAGSSDVTRPTFSCWRGDG